jgi:putative pyruvate formate lyase activating enzyme
MLASYRMLFKSGELANRVKHAQQILAQCTLCPRQCKVNRLKGELGFCKGGRDLAVASSGPHYGEEPPISGSNGSGAIFFTGCNIQCLFCQNYQISQQYAGHQIAIQELSSTMISLQKQGCNNINLVSPTHFVPQILEALLGAAAKGLTIPLVYNTNGYDSLATLQLLDGIIDIYLPDIKYSNDQYAYEYSSAKDYVAYNRIALKEMHRQVGILQTNHEGIAEHGLLIRHLVLPANGADSLASLDFIRQEVSKDTYMSLMAQYHPRYKATTHSILNRQITETEYQTVTDYAESLGLDNCYIQELQSSNDFLPDFNKDKPFNQD